MSDWKSALKTCPMDWLLESSNPSIRYWALKDLLEKSESVPEVVDAKEKIFEGEEIQIIFSKVNINGGPFWSRPDGNIYWGLSLQVTFFGFLLKQA